MFHGLTAEVLYCAARIASVFRDDLGHEITKYGTAFGVLLNGKQALTTNAHLLDINHGRTDAKYARYHWNRSFWIL